MLSMAAILFERRQDRALRRERVFRDRSNPLDLLPASEVKRRFRFSPETIMELVHIIGPSIEHPTARNHALQPLEMILILLRFLSCGTFQLVIGDTTNVSQPTVSRMVGRVVDAIVGVAGRYICFPHAAQVPAIKAKFHEMAGKYLRLLTCILQCVFICPPN